MSNHASMLEMTPSWMLHLLMVYLLVFTFTMFFFNHFSIKLLFPWVRSFSFLFLYIFFYIPIIYAFENHISLNFSFFFFPIFSKVVWLLRMWCSFVGSFFTNDRYYYILLLKAPLWSSNATTPIIMWSEKARLIRMAISISKAQRTSQILQLTSAMLYWIVHQRN